MKAQAKTKKLLVMFMVIAAILIGNTLTTFAAITTVHLPTTKWRVESSAIEGKHARISAGYVTQKSSLPVWFVIENNNGGYHDVAKEKVSPAKSPSGKTEYKTSKRYKYRLELNPYGTETKGSEADGTLTVL